MNWFLALAMLAACGGSADVCSGDPTQMGVISDLHFTRPVEGVSDGFDLDAQVSADGGNTGCGIGDYTSPEGSEGIDNALAGILPALELTEAAATEDIIHQTINNGTLLMMFALGGVDGMDDDCVDFSVHRAQGTPLIGQDNRLVPGQTFDLDPDATAVNVPGARMEDGVLVVHDITLDLPFQYFYVDTDLRIEDVSLRIAFEEDGSFTGYMAGSLDYWQIIAMADEGGADDDLVAALPGLFALVADLAPNDAGVCERMSVTMSFSGVNAFVYGDTAG